jgi:hypothetical protein
MRRAVPLLVIVMIGVLVALWRAATDPTPDHPPAPPPTITGPERPEAMRGQRAAGAAVGRTSSDELSRAAPQLELEALDPCSPVVEPDPPPGFDTKTVANITLAWRVDPDAEPLRVDMIARVAQGILDEAGAATGTPPRAQLTLVIYPSLGELRASTRAPPWAGGIYDGAVRVPHDSTRELGIKIATLRHEIMHAQLHAAIGCMPAWFNEGIATYFASDPNMHAILALLRDRDLLDVDAMAARHIQDLPDSEPSKHYAQSVAMVMYALSHRDGALDVLVARYRAAPDDARARVWETWFPGVRAAQLVDFLAQRVLGESSGPGLEALLRGPLCCSTLRDFERLGCRAATSRPADEPSAWIDRSHGAPTLCKAHY